MDRTRVAVEIYGTSYNLVGSSTEYMKQVARHVDEHMRTISKAHSRLDTPRIAVLTAVHMAEQAIQVQDIKNELNMLTGERSEQRVEISRLLEVQEERQEEYERFKAAAKEEAARLIAVVEEERARNLETREQELKIYAEQLQEAEQVAEAAREQLKADLLAREQELTALRASYTEEQEAARQQLKAELLEREQELAALQASYEEEQATDRETHRQELANAEAVHLQQLEELKAAHLQELESIRESLTKELVETRTLLSQELTDTKLTLGKELSEEREALQRELAKTKELRQSQGTQEHRHKQNVQELEKQLSELRGGTGQLQARLRAAEAGLKGERDARLTLLTQYELVSKREEQLGEELRSTTELGALLNDELEGLRQRYDLSQDEAAMLRKSLQETSDSLRLVQAELARSTAEVSTWQELADKRMEDISELEMKLLEAEEQLLHLQNEIQALHGQADGLVQKLDHEGSLRIEAENESKMLREQGKQAQTDLSALRTRYEELISQYDEVLQDGERLQERYRLLEEEGEQAALRLEELSEASREAAATAAEQQDVLKEARTYGTSWKHKYDELVQLQQQWTDTEAQLREEIDIWQREASEAEAQRESMDHERTDVLDQLGEVGENYEIVQGQLRLLQAQFEIRQSELDKLTDEHRKLQAEYAKLQTEYNEWIQLIEQDS